MSYVIKERVRGICVDGRIYCSEHMDESDIDSDTLIITEDVLEDIYAWCDECGRNLAIDD